SGTVTGQGPGWRGCPGGSPCLSRTPQCEVRPPIPPVARLVVLGAYGTLLAVTGHRDRILHAQRLQIAAGLQGALLAQHEVVFPAAALVAVTLDEEFDRRILPEEVGVLRQVLHPLAG